MQLGSSPMSFAPRSTYGSTEETFRAAFRLAASSIPFEIMGRPQHTGLGTTTSYPMCSSTLTAEHPRSG